MVSALKYADTSLITTNNLVNILKTIQQELSDNIKSKEDSVYGFPWIYKTIKPQLMNLLKGNTITDEELQLIVLQYTDMLVRYDNDGWYKGIPGWDIENLRKKLISGKEPTPPDQIKKTMDNLHSDYDKYNIDEFNKK